MAPRVKSTLLDIGGRTFSVVLHFERTPTAILLLPLTISSTRFCCSNRQCSTSQSGHSKTALLAQFDDPYPKEIISSTTLHPFSCIAFTVFSVHDLTEPDYSSATVARGQGRYFSTALSRDFTKREATLRRWLCRLNQSILFATLQSVPAT
jgi:hypothetical protein